MEYYNSNGTLMNVEQRSELERGRRNKFLLLNVDSINAVRWSAMSAPKQAEFIEYRQALLDVPQQEGFPENIIWPVKPEE